MIICINTPLFNRLFVLVKIGVDKLFITTQLLSSIYMHTVCEQQASKTQVNFVGLRNSQT